LAGGEIVTKRSDVPVPPEVVRAVEVLETASSPVELGPNYQILLDWRRRHPLPAVSRNAEVMLLPLALLAVLWLIPHLPDFEPTPFEQGLWVGLIIATFLYGLRDWLMPPAPPPPSLNSRIDAAIDRWRHAVPAMRVLPR
jgi:hypothetical protein